MYNKYQYNKKANIILCKHTGILIKFFSRLKFFLIYKFIVKIRSKQF
jgi:hypothetical protein